MTDKIEQFEKLFSTVEQEDRRLRDSLVFKPLDRTLIGKVVGLSVVRRLFTVATRDLERYNNTECILKWLLLKLAHVEKVQTKYTLDCAQRKGELVILHWTTRQLETILAKKEQLTCN